MNGIQIAIAIVFWICCGLLVYAYFAYPLLIWCLSRGFARRQVFPQTGSEELPTVSLLIAAYNEEAVIEERLKNALALDYPKTKLEIVVAADGCSDATPAIVRRYADQGVHLMESPQRRGKAAALNASFNHLTGDIVILSDANTHTDLDAVQKLVRWFRDPSVGVVCGRLVLTDRHTGRNADSLYWRYETFLKRSEGRLGALLGANGAIYAIRRSVYTPIRNDTLVDDLVIPLLARLRTGCRVVYDSEAVAHEETAMHLSGEFHRRSRIGAGGFQSMGLLWKLLDPRQGWVAFTFCSHKILRWLGPFLLIGALVTNLLLWDVPFFQKTLICQVAFYVIAVLGAYVPPRVRILKPLWLTTMFAGMNMALLLGFWRWLCGSQQAAWKRTARVGEAESLSASNTAPGMINGEAKAHRPKRGEIVR
jgi:cellulose synthase/poly-beta-1,6-N-acetylglucosamine synthase-like glycosyltransferase